MSANARKRANEQLANYWPAVFAALESDDETHVSPEAVAVPCPTCGTLLLGFCPHPRPQSLTATVLPIPAEVRAIQARYIAIAAARGSTEGTKRVALRYG